MFSFYCRTRPTLKERLIHKLELKTNWIFASSRRKKLNNTDFTIISNNCWGGLVYEYFGLPKLSPTVGCYFFAEDYLKFICNLKYYLENELKFIALKESKYVKVLEKRSLENQNAPIGKLDNVEIVFLHYKSESEVYEKWNRRIKRVNYNNLIFKFSQQNCCDEKHVRLFDNLELSGKKICFTNTFIPHPSNIYIYGYDGKSLQDTYSWRRNYNLIEFINSGNLIKKDK